MTTQELLNECGIWDKWSYSPASHEFIFFTVKSIFENEIFYVPKYWIKGNFFEYLKLISVKEARKNYTVNTFSFSTKI